MKGRAKHQDARDALFVKLRGEGLSRKEIAKKLGFRDINNVSHTARRLNLPHQSTCPTAYREGTRDISAAAKANRKRNAEKRAESRRRRRAGMNGRSDNPTPKMWRCSCGQICVTGPSHTQCEAAA
jgi:hypothetical protein